MLQADRFPPTPRGRALAGTVLAALGLLAILAVLDRPLQTEAASRGTISFELAGSEQRAGEIVDSWVADGEIARAAFALGLDYLFVPLFALGLAGLCLAVGRRLSAAGSTRFAAAAVPLALCALAGGVSDWCETTALAIQLIDQPESPWPQIARACAIAKFALNGVGLAYLLVGGGIALVRRGRAAPA